MQQWSKRMRLGRTGFNWGCLLVLIVIGGCSSEQTSSDEAAPQAVNKENLPAHIQDLDSLTVYPSDAEPPDTVELALETVFKSNDDVFINGNISDIAVDDKDKVYIVGQKPGTVGIYVFNPDGGFLTKFVNAGRGPGEVQAIKSILIRGNRLYVYDGILQKVCVFSLKDYSIINEFKIKQATLQDEDTQIALKPYDLVSVAGNGNVIMMFKSIMASNEYLKKAYYYIDKNGHVIPQKLLELRRYRIYETTKQIADGISMVPFTMPFNRNSLLAFSNDGSMYTAWTDEFLIKKFDSTGSYQKAIYYPYNKSRLALSDLEIRDDRREIIANNDVPETWPAVHNMVTDDQGRLWVLTITDSDSTYKGWVLDPSGKLRANFTWPGQREYRFIRSAPLYKVKNGYLYTRERDISNGIDRIVKHRINIHPKMHQEDMN